VMVPQKGDSRGKQRKGRPRGKNGSPFPPSPKKKPCAHVSPEPKGGRKYPDWPPPSQKGEAPPSPKIENHNSRRSINREKKRRSCRDGKSGETTNQPEEPAAVTSRPLKKGKKRKTPTAHWKKKRTVKLTVGERKTTSVLKKDYVTRQT